MSEEEKEAYMESVLLTEGIQLDRDKIQKNPGLRALAKIMLNSLVCLPYFSVIIVLFTVGEIRPEPQTNETCHHP